MERIELIELFKKNQTLLSNIYQFKIFEEVGVVGNITVNTSKTHRHIGFSLKYSNIIENFNVFLTLFEIENIMSPLLRKHGFIGGEAGELMITIMLWKLDPALYNETLNPTYPKVIKNEQDVIDLLQDLNTYTQQVAEPFFEKWSDLRALNEFLDNCPQMEISDYLGGYGAYSKLLVYKLCNNPRYEEYLKMMYNFAINRYKENPDGDIVIKQKHDFMIDFKEVLDRTEPIYNVGL